MEDKDFDQLLQKAVAQRCSMPLTDNLSARVIDKINYHKRKSRLQLFSCAAAIAALIVATIMIFDSRKNHETHPDFYVEATNITNERITNSSTTSLNLRNDINNYYIKPQQ